MALLLASRGPCSLSVRRASTMPSWEPGSDSSPRPSIALPHGAGARRRAHPEPGRARGSADRVSGSRLPAAPGGAPPAPWARRCAPGQDSGAPSALPSAVPRTFWQHRGQHWRLPCACDPASVSHRAAQMLWKACLHGSCTRCSSASTSSRQMAHWSTPQSPARAVGRLEKAPPSRIMKGLWLVCPLVCCFSKLLPISSISSNHLGPAFLGGVAEITMDNTPGFLTSSSRGQ
mmetsp:Transcript_29326/g.78338  ORF Transcript_29326/g.78338 Transcript_29326/m.78338 type:complete len:232 (-) Transcript_29326:424-1119(-)